MSVLDRGGDELRKFVALGRAAARRAGERVLDAVESSSSALQTTSQAPLEEVGDAPPVVARLIVEIRSDGSRTIARGGLEDLTTGQKVAVRAEGTTPAQLARSLASTLVTLPLFAARIARSIQRGEGAESGEPQAPPASLEDDSRAGSRPR